MRITFKKEPTPIEDNKLLAELKEEARRIIQTNPGETETVDHFLDGEVYEIDLA